MVSDVIRSRVRTLLDAVRARPNELPVAELIDLADRPVKVTIDRRGDEPLVFVSPRPDRRFDTLSPRELEVATLLAAGFANRQVAEALFISVATVKDHVHTILRKTDLSSRAEVAAAWYGHL